MKKLLIFISFIFTINMCPIYSQKAFMGIPAEDLVGTFIRDEEDDMASIELILKSYNQFYVKGITVSVSKKFGGLDYIVQYYYDKNIMKYETSDYTLTINILDENTLYITEEGNNPLLAIGTHFNGLYVRY